MWKCFIDVQNVFARLKTHRLQNVFISTSSQRIWSRLQSVFKIYQLNVSKTFLWCLQTINVLETSSSGLWNIWNCNFKHSVKYWIRLEHGFKYAVLQRTPWRLVRVPAGVATFHGKTWLARNHIFWQWFKSRCCELSCDKIQNFTVKNGIDWRFIPPSSPHMGGAWERLVGVIKRVMKAVFITRLTDETLEKTLCKMESTVYGRSLTKMSENPSDPSPLTPNHLLLMREGACHCPGKFTGHDVYKRRWRQVQHFADQFWRKWLKLYLPELQRRVKWHDVKANLWYRQGIWSWSLMKTRQGICGLWLS